MTHRALLLGAAYGSLLHVPRSLDRLEAALGEHGFRSIERHLDLPPEAFLAELDRFIATVEEGDPVAVVYVGHGGRREGFGYLRPSPGLRPVVGLELGERLAALVRVTRNITLLLDCCHAAGVVEDCTHLEGHALSRLVAAQCERVQRFEAFPGSSPLDQVVQLFAAAASQNALEDQDLACGLFSGVLADVLESCAGLDVAWHEVIDEVRMRMRPVDREQAPTLGGRHPRRVPFTERESSFYYHDFACAVRGTRLHLEAGALARITADDCFLVRPLGGPLDDAMPLASVTELSPAHAVLSLADPAALLPTGVPLRAVRTTAPPAPPPSRWQQLAGAVALAPALSVDAIDLRWGRIDDHGRPGTHLPPRAAAIGPDDDLWLALGVRRNRHAYQLFFAVFHLDPDDRLVSLLPAYPQGLLLACDQHYLLASRLAQGLGHGDTLAWRRQQPPGEHSLIVLASNRKLAIDAIVRSGREALDDALSPPLAGYALTRLQFSVTDPAS